MDNPEENAYALFRRVSTNYKQSLSTANSYFIQNSASSTSIYAVRAKKDYTVVLVMTDKEGGDELYLYTDVDSDLKLGDYFTRDEVTYFIYEKVKIIKEEDYKKFKVLECNVTVNLLYSAYFLGTTRSAKDNGLSNSIYVESNINPMLILPTNDDIHSGISVTIANQNWSVIEQDINTITGISYLTLKRGVNIINPETAAITGDADLGNYVNTEISLTTENGYFKCDSSQVRLIRKAATEIVIKFISSGTYNYSIKKDSEIVSKTIEIKGVV